MKKYLNLLIIALLAAMPMILSACGGDEDDEPDSMIVGKWSLSRSVLKTSIYDFESHKWMDEETIEEGEGETWEFTKDKLIMNDPNYAYNSGTYDYSFNPVANLLYIFDYDDYKVKKITDSELVIVQEETHDYYKIYYAVEFKRI